MYARKALFFIACFGLAAILILLITAWAATRSVSVVKPPDSLREPEKVALVDYGRHARMLLPDGKGEMTLYAYGDWNYFARSRTGVLDSLAALLWPTPSALGKRQLAGPLDHRNVTELLSGVTEELLLFQVEKQRVEQLRARLEELFARRTDTAIYNRSRNLHFVQLEEKYWALNNSNQRVAAWLEELGCEVHGLALYSNWKIEE